MAQRTYNFQTWIKFTSFLIYQEMTNNEVWRQSGSNQMCSTHESVQRPSL